MKNTKRILLTGGTGQLGKRLLTLFESKSITVDIVTRNEGYSSTPVINYIPADLANDRTLGVLHNHYDVVVHCASNPRESDTTDVQGTENLLKAIKNHTGHFVFISIVGVEKSNFKYYQNKLKIEKMIIESGIPYTILRVAQFHDFVYNRVINGLEADDNILSIPSGLKFQSIDLDDVCDSILESVTHHQTNSVVEIGGPEILTIEEMVTMYQDILKPDKKIEMTTSLNDFQRLFTTGINLCPESKTGTLTWERFLENKKLHKPAK